MTERSESERAELVRVADDLDSFVHDMREDGNDASALWLEQRASALRSLAAQDQKPVAWPSDGSCIRCSAVPRTASGLCNTCLDEDAERYENSPPPDAGWVNGCDKTAPAALRYLSDHELPTAGQQKFNAEHLLQIADELEQTALRHNAPPDSGAGKSETELPPLTCDFAQALPGGKLDDSTYSKIEDALDKIEAPVQDASGKWLSLHERIAAIELPDHGGADAGPTSAFEVIADHFGLKKKAALSKPAPVAANASAEAQLRKALEQIIRYCDESTDPVIALTAKKALSTHPRASDCDKQGER